MKKQRINLKPLITIIITGLLTSCAMTPSDKLSYMASSASRGLELTKVDQQSLTDPDFIKAAEFIYGVLYNTSEINTHRMNGETENIVIVHESGGEIVFDKNKQRVTSCANKGSYNYAHYKQTPLEHFSVDILPWLRWGNCREAETTLTQRIDAYALDFEASYRFAVAKPGRYFLPEGIDLTAREKETALRFFITAFELANFDLIKFIDQPQHSEAEHQTFIAALKLGMIRVLENQ